MDMDNFFGNCGLTLIFGAIFGLLLIVCVVIAEKSGLSDKLSNMFADKENNNEKK